MFVTIITDCRDDNARTRQETRYAHLFPSMHMSFIGASSDIEAAGNLMDVLDSADDSPGIIAVNCAPRQGQAKKWKNGSPFGYVWFQNKLIVGTIDGLSFGFLKRFSLIDHLCVTEITTALPAGGYTAEQVKAAANTQFRSLNYLPRLAKIVWEKHEVPSEKMPVSEIPDMPSAVWWIDSFGNVKTTLTSQDVNFVPQTKKRVEFTNGTHLLLPCVERLADVPDNEPALIIGSSGFQSHRFVELVVQGVDANAAGRFNIHKGDFIQIH
ncbi:hypothetical protein HYV70_04790 [Candidatus Uhrbacteria bacterium]|nr:hypothetical protein [Candidatus Uhrbacteria bacterium]